MCFAHCHRGNRVSAVVALSCLAALVPGAMLLSGCGSGGHSIQTTQEETVTNSYYGTTYLAKNLVLGDLGGSLSIEVSQDGTARGALVLSQRETTRAQVHPQAHAHTRQTEDDPSGGEPTDGDGGDTVFATAYDPYNITLSGSFDAATGKFTMSGTYVVGGDAVVPVTVTGTLPTPPQGTGGTITIDINGTTYPSAAFTSVYHGGNAV